jgi:dihydropteroate synthase
LVIQIIRLSSKDIFQKYFEIIKSGSFIYELDGFLLEVREIPNDEINFFKDLFIEGNNIFYLKEKSLTGSQARNLQNIVFIHGSISWIKSIVNKIPGEKIKNKISQAINNYLNYNFKSYSIGNKEFNFSRAYVMGILNVTPDSFSDGGLYLNSEDAANHALEMLEDGADIIDIGGESTRPGSDIVDAEDELQRVIPVIDKILSIEPETIISIDSTKSRVAEEALEHGAKIINDISGATFDEKMLGVASKYPVNTGLILMHIKGVPKTMQENPYYENVIEEVYDFLNDRIKIAESAGVQNIFIDPGIGFGKRSQDNFEILKRLEDFKGLGYPLAIGASRKSFLGKKLNLDILERDTPTAIVESIAVKNGARIIRTHNVKYGKQVCELLNSLN